MTALFNSPFHFNGSSMLISIKNIRLNRLSMLTLYLAGTFSPISYAEDLAIITNMNNTNTTLTQSEAINIFLGRFRQFANGTKAIPLDNDSLKNDFYIQLVNKSPSEIKAYWATLVFSGRTQPPKSVKDTKNVIDAIRQETQAITYIPADQVNNQVKVLLVLKEKQ
jgi:antitoxin component of RelBE/YafQ-DinJ toxin-antitoxin module